MISDVGLQELLTLTDFTSFDLRETKITAQALIRLVGVKHVQSLIIDRDTITDELAATFGRANRLEALQWDGQIRRQAKPAEKGSRRVMAEFGKEMSKALGLDKLFGANGEENQLRRLDLAGTKITDKGLAEFTSDKTLEAIILSKTAVTDASLKLLCELPALQVVKLDSTAVSAEGLKTLAVLKKLHTLHIDPEKVTDDLLGTFRKAGLLHSLHAVLDPLYACDGNILFSIDISVHVQYTRPESVEKMLRLSLEKTKITDAGLKELAGCVGVQAVILSQSQVTDAGLARVAAFPDLRILDLHDSKITTRGLKELKGLPKLRILCISSDKIDDDLLIALGEAKLLHTLVKELSIGHLTKTDAPMFPEEGTDLDLSFSQITNRGLKELTRVENLRSLNLGGTQITDTDLKHVGSLESLRSLNLASTPITDDGLKYLAGLSRLRDLGLSNTQITDAGMRELSGVKSLQCVLLSYTKVSDASMKVVGQWRDLEILDLDHTKVGDAGLKELSELRNEGAADGRDASNRPWPQ